MPHPKTPAEFLSFIPYASKEEVALFKKEDPQAFKRFCQHTRKDGSTALMLALQKYNNPVILTLLKDSSLTQTDEDEQNALSYFMAQFNLSSKHSHLSILLAMMQHPDFEQSFQHALNFSLPEAKESYFQFLLKLPSMVFQADLSLLPEVPHLSSTHTTETLSLTSPGDPTLKPSDNTHSSQANAKSDYLLSLTHQLLSLTPDDYRERGKVDNFLHHICNFRNRQDLEDLYNQDEEDSEAAYSFSYDAFHQLINQTVNLHPSWAKSLDEQGQSPLFLALLHYELDFNFIRPLFEHSDLLLQTPKHGFTVLHQLQYLDNNMTLTDALRIILELSPETAKLLTHKGACPLAEFISDHHVYFDDDVLTQFIKASDLFSSSARIQGGAKTLLEMANEYPTWNRGQDILVSDFIAREIALQEQKTLDTLTKPLLSASSDTALKPPTPHRL